jgi:hypothetical protein
MVNWKALENLARERRISTTITTEDDLLRSLQVWWCVKYSRPFKDPLLASYTIDELAYEYLTYFFTEPENDPRKKKETEKAKDDDEAWIKKQLENMKTSVIPPPKEEIPENLPEISTKFD